MNRIDFNKSYLIKLIYLNINRLISIECIFLFSVLLANSFVTLVTFANITFQTSEENCSLLTRDVKIGDLKCDQFIVQIILIDRYIIFSVIRTSSYYRN